MRTGRSRWRQALNSCPPPCSWPAMWPVSQTGRYEGAVLARSGFLASRRRRSHVAFGPLAEPEEAGANRAAALGQPVDHAQRGTVENRPIDQAGTGQLVEPVGQHALADPGNRPSQDGEPCRALEEQSEDDARPALAQQGEGLGQTLIAFARVLFQPPRHAASVAPSADHCRNLQKVSLRW